MLCVFPCPSVLRVSALFRAIDSSLFLVVANKAFRSACFTPRYHILSKGFIVVIFDILDLVKFVAQTTDP